MSSPWAKLLERPHSGGHFVQLYQADESSLTRNVGHYIWGGLRGGDRVLIIATPEHQDAFMKHLESLGPDARALLDRQQLVVLDAQDTLLQFMVEGQPDWQRFERVIRNAMRNVHPVEGAEGLRAYGEMVGLLWKVGHFAAAVRLEQLWNKLLEQSSFSLYCAYAIDIFGEEFEVANLDGVLCTHTHLVPAQQNGAMELAVNQALDEVLGSKADGLRVVIKANYRPAWAVMPTAERMILWLRKNLPNQADRIVETTRRHYQQLARQPAGLASE